jgi:hypothetical protein
MTKTDALKANLSQVHGIVIDDLAFEKACTDEGFSGSEVYSKADEQAIDMATVRIYKQVLGAPGISEGNLNYQITNKEHIKSVIDSLLVKWGKAPEFGTRATVSGARPW